MRTYMEANVRLQVLDGRDAPLAELIGNAAAQEDLAARLVIYLGCVRDNRLYVSEARRLEIPMTYSSGEVLEPGTELVVNVRTMRLSVPASRTGAISAAGAPEKNPGPLKRSNPSKNRLL